MRLFIAVEIPEDVKEELGKTMEALKRKVSSVKWVEKENFHITLRFIGEVQEDKLPVIENIIEEVSSKFSPFDIELKGVGNFPYVIWIGIDKGKEILSDISYSIEGPLIKAGFPPADKLFSPHITLGRVKKKIENFQGVDFGPLSFRADSITLMQSQLFSSGPVYTPLKVSPFKKI
jgi:2'-5' RNA ligase